MNTRRSFAVSLVDALVRNRRTVITCAVLVICISISVPLAVYGAVFSDNEQAADIDILASNTGVSTNFDSESLYSEGLYAAMLPPTLAGSNSARDDELSDVEVKSDIESDEKSSDDESSASETPDDESADVVDEETFTVNVSFYDREALSCETGKTTLRELLAQNGIWLGENEHPSVDLDSTLEYDSWISVDKTEYATVTESEAIPYSTETVNVTSIPRGTYKTISAGQAGVRDTVYTVEYLNGVEVSRTEEYDYIASYPVNEVCYYGTGGTFTAPDGNVYSYSYAVDVRASYYNIYGTTASGMPTGTNVVATDPSVFPLGTQMYIMNSSFDLGLRTAADTGGAVRGNFIDIWMDGSCPYYEQFAAQGVWDVTVYVLG